MKSKISGFQKFIIISYLVFIGLMTLIHLVGDNSNIINDYPIVNKGKIDFEGKSIASRDNIFLDGKWELYYNQWIVTDGVYNTESFDDYAQIPEYTNINVNDLNYKIATYNTYKLDVYNLAVGDTITIDIVDCSSAFRIFFNNELVCTNGFLSKEKGKTYVSSRSYNLKPIEITDENASHSVIIIETSSNLCCGISKIPTISGETQKYVSRILYSSLDVLILSLIFSLIIFSFTDKNSNKDKKAVLFSVIVKSLLLLGSIFSRVNFHLLQILIPNFYSYEYTNLFVPYIYMLAYYMYFIQICYNFKKKISKKDLFYISLFLLFSIISSLIGAICFNFSISHELAFGFVMIILIYILIVIFRNYKNCFTSKVYLVVLSVYFLTAYIAYSTIYGKGYIKIELVIPLTIFFIGYIVFILHYIAYENKQRVLIVSESIKIKEELVDKNISLLMSQIKPHFLYNTLNSIKYLCKTNPKAAEEAVVKFASFLRVNMKCIESNSCIDFLRELDHVKNYVEIEKIRFGERLEYKEEILDKDFKLPPLTIQPLVENCIKHGISKKLDGGYIYIKTKLVGNFHVIEIIDNGIGFDTFERDDSLNHLGIMNVEKRLNMMCNGTLSVESRINDGTKYTISIPKL